MQKRKIFAIGVFIVMVAVLAAGLILVTQRGKQAAVLEHLLPDGPVVYVKCRNIERNIKDFFDSELIKGLSAIDFYQAMEKMGASAKEIAVYKSFLNQFQSPENQLIFSKIFGQEVAIAAYPVIGEEGKNETVLDRLSSLVIVTRIKREVRFIEVLTAALAKFNPNFTERRVEYKDQEIHFVGMAGGAFELGYTRFGNFLVIGIGERSAAAAIDVWSGGRKDLTQDPRWIELQDRQLVESDKMGFFRYGDFMAELKESLLALSLKGSPMDDRVKEQIEEGFRSTQGLKDFVFSAVYGDVIKARFDMSFDIRKIPEEVVKFYDVSPEPNRSLTFVPPDMTAYSWSTMMGLPFYLQAVEKQVKMNQPLGPVAGVVQEMNFDVLMRLFSNELGWYFSGVEFSKLLPVPKFVLFLGVREAKQAELFLRQQIGAQSFFPIQTEEYKGTTISYLGGLPFLSSIEPAYCVMDGYLLISTQREMLRRSLDLNAEPQAGIQTNAVVSNQEYRLTENGNGLFFIQFDELMKNILEVVGWANEWADIQDKRRQEFRKGAELRLEDVKAQRQEKQQEADSMEARLLELEAQKEEMKSQAVDLVKMDEDISRKQKFIDAAQKALDRVAEEQKKLMAAREDAGQRLTEAGQARLEEVDREVMEKTAKLEELRSELKQLENTKDQALQTDQAVADLAGKIAEQKERFAEARNSVQRVEEAQAEVERLIKSYEKSALPTPEERAMMIKDIINPMIRAFMNIEWFAAKTRIEQNRIQSEVFLKIK